MPEEYGMAALPVHPGVVVVLAVAGRLAGLLCRQVRQVVVHGCAAHNPGAHACIGNHCGMCNASGSTGYGMHLLQEQGCAKLGPNVYSSMKPSHSCKLQLP